MKDMLSPRAQEERSCRNTRVLEAATRFLG